MRQKKLLSLLLAVVMLASLGTVGAFAEKTDIQDIPYIENLSFDDGVISENFIGTVNEEGDFTNTIVDGKLNAVTKGTQYGGLAYDLSEFGSLADLECKRLVFEFDYYPKNIDLSGKREHHIKITDANGNNYNDFYLYTGANPCFYASATSKSISIAANNASEEDVDKYYRIKMTLNAVHSMQSVEIAEMRVESTGAPVYTSLMENIPYTADGTLGKLVFLETEGNGWQESGLTVQLDNIKVYKVGYVTPDAVIDIDFEDGIVPADLKGTVNAEGDFTNTIIDGKLNAVTKGTKFGGLVYDVSTLGSISDLGCRRLVFEFDYYPKNIDLSGSREHHIKITDANGNNYNDFYLYTGANPCFYEKTTSARFNITANNLTTEDTDKYYKIKMTLNAKYSTQSVEIAEMSVDSTEAPIYTSFLKNIPYTADGTLGELVFLKTEGTGWHEPGLTIQLDNIKITKSGNIDPDALFSEDFDDGIVPTGFAGIVNSEGDFTNTVVDGKLNAVTKGTQFGGLSYDLSDSDELMTYKSERIVTEFDYYPKKIDTSANRTHKIKLTDASGNNYSEISMITGTAPYFSASSTRFNITANNLSDTDIDKYYKIKITLNIFDETQSVEIAEMSVGSTEAPVYTSLVKDAAYTADGALGKLVFLETVGNGWQESGLTIQLDNFKIYKDGILGDMILTSSTPNDNAVFAYGKQPVVLTFSNPVDEATKAGITVSDIETSVSVEKNKVTVTPISDYVYGKEYTLTVAETVKDICGQSFKEEKTLTFSMRSNPVAVDGDILAKNTFDSESELSDFVNDGTAAISDGMLCYNRSQAVNTQGYLKRVLNIDMTKQASDVIIMEYDLYPIAFRDDGSSTWQFDFPAIYTEQESKVLSYTLVPFYNKIYGDNGYVLSDEFNYGEEYMYHVKITVDFENSDYIIDFEGANLLTDGYKNTTLKTTGEQKFTNTSEIVDNITFIAPNKYANSKIKIDNFVCYTPVKKEVTTVKYENNTAVITVTNYDEKPMDLRGFFVVYGSSGAFDRCEILTPEAPLNKGESKTFNCSYSEGDTVKVFTWDKDMMPLDVVK